MKLFMVYMETNKLQYIITLESWQTVNLLICNKIITIKGIVSRDWAGLQMGSFDR
jgi:hypothetical protein